MKKKLKFDKISKIGMRKFKNKFINDFIIKLYQ